MFYISKTTETNYKLLLKGIDLKNYTVQNGLLVTAQQKDTKDARTIRACIGRIFEELSTAATRSPSLLDRRQAAYMLRQFAFGPAALLSPTFFDRAVCTKAIQNILSPKLHKLRMEKAHAPYGSQDTGRRLQAKIAKAHLAFNLGINPTPNSAGAEGSYILKDLRGKAVGIFKESKTRKPSLRKRMKTLFSNLFGMKRQLHFMPGEGSLPSIYSDVASALAGKFFSIPLIPETTRILFDRKDAHFDGTFMVWEHHMKPSTAFKPNSSPSQKELTLFQKMAILDYLIGNLDRHQENWLVQTTPTGALSRISLIDNSNAFLKSNPRQCWKDLYGRKNQYAWKKHPYARFPFTPEIKSLLNTLTPSKGRLFWNYLEKELLRLGLPQKEIFTFMNPKVYKRFLERVHVISVIKKNGSPQALGRLSTKETLKKWRAAIFQKTRSAIRTIKHHPIT